MIPKTPLLHTNARIDYVMGFGLVHPLHPIWSKSRNERRNWMMCFLVIVIVIVIVIIIIIIMIIIIIFIIINIIIVLLLLLILSLSL